MLRRPDSIPSSDTLIQDKVMEPYFVSRSSSGGYTVYERVITGENNTEYIKTLGYPSNFGNALRMIARELTNEEGKTFTLKEYMQRWENVRKALTSVME